MRHLFVILTLILISITSFSQNKSLPSVTVETLQGERVDISNIENDGNPIILSFWATWCKPCIRELNAIAEVYPEW